MDKEIDTGLDSDEDARAFTALMIIFLVLSCLSFGYWFKGFEAVVKKEALKIKHQNCERELAGSIYMKGVE